MSTASAAAATGDALAAPLAVVIADDEPLVRRRIRRLLAGDAGLTIVAECQNGTETVAAVRALEPQLLFLDIQLPELDGFGVVAALGPTATRVIFVTAFDEYALKAFEVHALDYVLKPFDGDRLRAAVRRARAELERDASAQHGRRIRSLLDQLREGDPLAADLSALVPAERAAPSPKDRLMIKDGGSLFFIKTGDIDWIEAAGNYARVYAGRDVHLIRETMHSLEARLDPHQFVRIHRSTIVNLDRVKEMQPWFNGEYVVLLHDGRQLKLSRWYRSRLGR
ncbi:MAG: LytTR family DNA-binding domain-containing protein [Gemmatimonadaceae bacterium]